MITFVAWCFGLAILAIAAVVVVGCVVLAWVAVRELFIGPRPVVSHRREY